MSLYEEYGIEINERNYSEKAIKKAVMELKENIKNKHNFSDWVIEGIFKEINGVFGMKLTESKGK